MKRAALFLVLLCLAGCNQEIGPLHKAARIGDIDGIHALIRAGADPDERAGVNGWPALMHAVHKNKPRAIVALVEAGADPNARSTGGETALIMAAGYGQTDMVRTLLSLKADPRIEAPGGRSALTAAISGAADIDRFTLGECQTETVKTLLDQSPELRWRNTVVGKVSLLAARLGGCNDVLRMVERRRRD